MSNVYIDQSGNGSCYVDNYYPENGDVITIYAYPDSGADLLDLYCYSEYGYSIAIGVMEEQQLTYDSTWGNITITATFSSDKITVDSSGNGSAAVDDNNPSDGQAVVLTCIPDRKYTVSSIICTDSNGNVLWTSTDLVVSFTYSDSWGAINIYVTFDLKWIFKNLWILSRREWWRKNNF